jgi:large subunit ribosomal protein L5
MNPPRLQQKYKEQVVPKLMAEFKYKTVMAVPRIEKAVVNVGFGKIAKEGKVIEKIEGELIKITGQKPVFRKAKKSIAGFKLRQGVPIGMVVTLRGRRMYDFIDRLINIALPRTRDFRGIGKESFDNLGNLSIGIREHNIFPEAGYETAKDIFGFSVTITTSAREKDEGVVLLRLMGFPIKE